MKILFISASVIIGTATGAFASFPPNPLARVATVEPSQDMIVSQLPGDTLKGVIDTQILAFERDLKLQSAPSEARAPQ